MLETGEHILIKRYPERAVVGLPAMLGRRWNLTGWHLME